MVKTERKEEKENMSKMRVTSDGGAAGIPMLCAQWPVSLIEPSMGMSSAEKALF